MEAWSIVTHIEAWAEFSGWSRRTILISEFSTIPKLLSNYNHFWHVGASLQAVVAVKMGNLWHRLRVDSNSSSMRVSSPHLI